MAKDSFVFYKSWNNVISGLPTDVQLEIYHAITEYAINGNLVELKPLAKVAFAFIKQDIDRDTEKYMSKANANRENGKKGGAPKGNQNAKKKQPKTTQNNPTVKKQPYNVDVDVDDYVFIEEDKSSLSDKSDPLKQKDFNFEKFVSFFNKKTKGVFGSIRNPLSRKRKQMLLARINEYGLASLNEVLEKALASDFLKGQNRTNFTANFDWIIKPTNYEKILSDNYRNNDNKINRKHAITNYQKGKIHEEF